MPQEVDTELYYLAGLFDGEGACGAYKASQSWTVSVGLDMTNAQGPQAMANRFGGDVHYYPSKKENEQPIYSWTRASYKALQCLRELQPFLRVKQDQVALTLNTVKRLDSMMRSETIDEILADYRLHLPAGGARKGGRPKGAKDKRPRARTGYLNRYQTTNQTKGQASKPLL